MWLHGMMAFEILFILLLLPDDNAVTVFCYKMDCFMEPLISGLSISSALDQLYHIYLHFSSWIWIWQSFLVIIAISVSGSLQNSLQEPFETVNLNIDGEQYRGSFPKIYGVHFRGKIGKS